MRDGWELRGSGRDAQTEENGQNRSCTNSKNSTAIGVQRRTSAFSHHKKPYETTIRCLVELTEYWRTIGTLAIVVSYEAMLYGASP